MRTWSFAKGHGTLNDFVLVKDRSGMLNPSAQDVRFLCDRRGGIGGDGFLRAVKAENMPEWDGPGNRWFMDYRNADGSVAEMCGNGIRVFVRWLLEEDLAGGDVIEVATRAGLRRARVCRDGQISATMGTPYWSSEETWVRLGDREWHGHPVDVGNDHCVVRVTEEDLAGLDLTRPLELDGAVFPRGANVEFVVDLGPDEFRMRVLERGVGETMSCGTGVVAASCDQRARTGFSSTGRGDQRLSAPGGEACGSEHTAHVPGGILKVEFDTEGRASLTGPAVIVARGEVTLPDE